MQKAKKTLIVEKTPIVESANGANLSTSIAEPGVKSPNSARSSKQRAEAKQLRETAKQNRSKPNSRAKRPGNVAERKGKSRWRSKTAKKDSRKSERRRQAPSGPSDA